MRHLRNTFARFTASFTLLVCLCPFVPAQTKSEPDVRTEFVPFVMTAYRAFERQDRPALLALCNASSPHCDEFRQILQEQAALVENVKLELKRVLILKASINGDRAEIRVLSNFVGVDADGHRAEGIPREWDHRFQLIKVGDEWQLWRLTDTAEELAESYLKTTSEDERANLIANAPPLTFGFIHGLLQVGQSLLEARGNAAGAEIILELALRLANEAKSRDGGAGALIGLGDVYLAQGDYARAANNYQQVMTLAENLNSKEGIAAVSVKMGNLHYQQGNISQAMEHYLKSVRLYEELGSKLEITYPLVNLGSAYFSTGDYEKALEHYLKIQKIYEQLYYKAGYEQLYDNAGTAWLLNKIADVYAAQGKQELALANYSRSLKTLEELGNRPMQASSLNGIGRIRFKEGKYAEALTLFTRAAVLARSGNSPEILWRTLHLLGQTHRRLNEMEPARKALDESIEIVERLRNQVAGSARDQELSFEGRTAPYLEMVELLVEQNKRGEAFVYSERAKGRMLLDVLRNNRADISQSMTVDERNQEQSLNASLTSISSQIRRESSLPKSNVAKLAEMETRLQQARLEYEAYETRIYAAHPELRTQRGEAQTVSMKEIEILIPDGQTALLEYVVGADKSYLFVLTRSGTATTVALKVFTIPITAEELARRVIGFRQLLARNSPGFKEPARQLYDLLLEPAQKELVGKNTLCIVPSNQLWELPFQALITSADKYVVENHALYYVPSLSVLREIRKKDSRRRTARSQQINSTVSSSTDKSRANAPSGTPSLLALGNPTLSAISVAKARATDRSLSFAALPEAEREVKALAEIYGAGKSKILTGTAAGEEIAKAEAGNYSVLHFATHGVLDNDNPLYSRLLLASSSESDDGYLEAREIMKLDLRADLAVLSACQTGLGHVSDGEGLIGMSWALFLAGTSTTVTSQWKVDSASTARLMIDFHRVLQGSRTKNGVSKAEALRQASIGLMADPKYRHPFFWAGFVVVGEGR